MGLGTKEAQGIEDEVKEKVYRWAITCMCMCMCTGPPMHGLGVKFADEGSMRRNRGQGNPLTVHNGLASVGGGREESGTLAST